MIVPTIISNDTTDLYERCKELGKYSNTLHLDIMDGVFVKNKSIWFDEFYLTMKNRYEAHLMIDNPEDWVYKTINNLDRIIVNIERVKDVPKLITRIKRTKQEIGFSLNPETSIDKIKPYLNDLDCVLILTVNPGQYGAPFIPECLDKVKALREIYSKDIEVDGSVNPLTIKQCKDAGANIFAVGSYIQNSPDKAAAIKHLESILGQ